MLAFLFENTIFCVQISFYNIYPYILAGSSETKKAVKLRHLNFLSLSLLRVAVEDETSALQTLSSMERPAVSLH